MAVVRPLVMPQGLLELAARLVVRRRSHCMDPGSPSAAHLDSRPWVREGSLAHQQEDRLQVRLLRAEDNCLVVLPMADSRESRWHLHQLVPSGQEEDSLRPPAGVGRSQQGRHLEALGHRRAAVRHD